MIAGPITPIEQIHGMHDLEALALSPGFAGDLQQAAGVGGHDNSRAGALDVGQFAAAEALGHFGLGQVIGSSRAAAEFGFGKVHER